MRSIVDLSTGIGVILAFLLVVIAIQFSQQGGGIGIFLDLRSALIVLGGTYFLTTACFTLREIWAAQGLVWKTMFYHAENPARAAVRSLELAEIARKKGLLGLQKHTNLIGKKHSFLEKGLNLIVDGIPHEDAATIMRNEINAIMERHQKSHSILKKAADIAPAMGLIGTLIGLVQMLGNLNDPSSIGPAMAIALLTTLYGAVLSFMVLTPLAAKLERNSKAEVMIMNIYLNTVISVGRKENPRRLEMLINAILPPSKRVKYFS